MANKNRSQSLDKINTAVARRPLTYFMQILNNENTAGATVQAELTVQLNKGRKKNVTLALPGQPPKKWPANNGEPGY